MVSWLLLTLFATIAGSSGEATVTTLEGRAASGTISAWTANEVSLKTADGAVVFPAAELLSVQWDREPAEDAAALHLEFTDGGRMRYSEFAIAKRIVTVKSGLSKEPLRVSRDAIRMIQLRPSTSFVETALDEIERKGAPGDALVVSQRDSETMDYLTGVIGEVTAEQASFEWDGERVPVKRSKIAAMVFYHAREASLPEVNCELSLVDGSRVPANEVALRGDRVSVATPAGVSLEFSLDQIVSADFSTGKIAYLSDMKASDVRWTPAIGVPADTSITARNTPRNNTSFSGSPLSLLWNNDAANSRRDIRTYAKGLALRSRTEVAYRLPAGMKRFVAIAGLDPHDAGQGNVSLEIRGGDRVLWEGVVEGGQKPVEINVELGAARRLHLTVGYGTNLDYGDRLHLIEARLTK